MSELILGIDLGTTNSLAATVFPEGPEVVAFPGQSPIIPSVVTQTEAGWIVGQEALPYRLLTPERTIYSVKRLMGRDLSEVQNDLQHLPYRVVSAQRKLVKIELGGESYTPQEISAEILKKVKAQAEAVLGQAVHKAVITVPAYFDDAQRQATRDAGKIAGLEVVRILNEPTAAAIAYGLDQKAEGYVAVYDLGGGTFDISILKLTGKLFKVVSTHGNTHLGGDDFDQLLAGLLRQRLLEAFPQVSCHDSLTQQTLKQAAEQIKIELSRAPEAPYLLTLPQQNITLPGMVTAQEFEAMLREPVAQTLQSCQQALEDAGLNTAEIDEVVLVGGSTLVPYVRKQVQAFFGRAPHIAIDPYKVVAIGAGIQGHLLAGGRRDFVLLDVIPLALGIETLGGTFSKLITRNTTIPTEASELFTTHVDFQTSIDINIYQGERELVKDCRALGRFKLRGIPPMKAGLPLVQVTFRVDANGILTVSALEQRSQTAAEIEVIPFHGLTQAEIEAIMERSFEYAIEDFNERQLIEFRNTVERVFKGIEEAWPVAEKMFSEAERALIRRQMKTVQEYAAGQDPHALKEQMDVLGEMTRTLADASISEAILAELRPKLPASE